jgi:hypothetical protein
MDVHELEHMRQHKNQMFRDDPHSPLRPEQRARFAGLRYFPPDPQLQLELPLEPADGSTLEIPTSDGSTRRYRRSGRVRLEIDGEQAELVLLTRQGEHGFFLPFRDATSGRESYGAGRYLDVEPGRHGRLQVDFNSPTTRTAPTTTPSPVRCRRRRTGCACRSGPAKRPTRQRVDGLAPGCIAGRRRRTTERRTIEGGEGGIDLTRLRRAAGCSRE